MAAAILVSFIDLFVLVFNVLVLIRVLMSWFNPMPDGGIGGLIFDLTEPVLAPFRRIMPNNGMFDLTPLAALISLQLLAELAHRLIPR